MNKPSETKPCPECERYLPVSAIACRCGWKAPQAAPTWIPCAFAGCGTSATLKVKTKTGWANVCLDHDVTLVQKRANEVCKELGLDTVAKQRAWLLKNGKMPRSLRVNIEREVSAEEESIPF
jgi:hypothetical protein